MAGCRAVEEILARDPDRYRDHDLRRRAAGELQPHHALAGARRARRASTRSSSTPPTGTPRTASSWSPAIRSITSTASAQTVIGRSGRVEPYDRLLIATGSDPFIIPVPGTDLPGVVTFRDLDDVDKMLAAAGEGGDAVVIGGGLLGLEAAHGLSLRGMKVTVVHLMPTLMERQLDEAAGWLLKTELERRGQTILTGADTAGDPRAGRPRRGRAAQGRARDPGRPRGHGGRHPALDRRSPRPPGSSVERGIMVDDHMVTSDPDDPRGRRMRPASRPVSTAWSRRCGRCAARWPTTLTDAPTRLSGLGHLDQAQGLGDRRVLGRRLLGRRRRRGHRHARRRARGLQARGRQGRPDRRRGALRRYRRRQLVFRPAQEAARTSPTSATR